MSISTRSTIVKQHCSLQARMTLTRLALRQLILRIPDRRQLLRILDYAQFPSATVAQRYCWVVLVGASVLVVMVVLRMALGVYRQQETRRDAFQPLAVAPECGGNLMPPLKGKSSSIVWSG